MSAESTLTATCLVLITSGDGAAEVAWAEQHRGGVAEIVVVTPTESAQGAVRASSVRPEVRDDAGVGACVWAGLWLTKADRAVFADTDRHGLPDLAEVRTLVAELDNVQLALLQTGDDTLTQNLVDPTIAFQHPHLSHVSVRPSLWAVRRDHLEMLPVPFGEGPELAAVLDTDSMYGIEELKQVPSTAANIAAPEHRLGRQAAVQLVVVLERRRPERLPVTLDPLTIDGEQVRIDEAPPAAAVPGYYTR